MSTLSVIVGEAAEIIQKLIENGGEVDESLELDFVKNSIDLKDKLDSYAYLWERLDREEEYFKVKAAELTRIKSSINNIRDRLKDRLKSAMVQLDESEIVGSEFKFKLAKTSGRLLIKDESLIPSDYKTQIVYDELDKGKLKEALAKGLEIPGAELVKDKSLRKYINRSK